MSDKSKTQRQELFEQAMKNYEEALQAGLKLQQESAKWWMGLLSHTGSVHEWQATWNEVSSRTMSTFQRRMEENLKLVEHSSKNSLELLKKAMDTASAETIPAAQTKLEELWQASLEGLRSNAKAINDANAKWVESWMQFAPKSGSRSAA